jgi:hypothetical protein
VALQVLGQSVDGGLAALLHVPGALPLSLELPFDVAGLNLQVLLVSHNPGVGSAEVGVRSLQLAVLEQKF